MIINSLKKLDFLSFQNSLTFKKIITVRVLSLSSALGISISNKSLLSSQLNYIYVINFNQISPFFKNKKLLWKQQIKYDNILFENYCFKLNNLICEVFVIEKKRG